MSPNCNLGLLPRASQQWARTFPLAPPLTNFLAELSYAPRPYKTFCPSKAHRPTYLAMLAWLMRGGWVTQLCTFAYVVVWPEIIYEVQHQLEADELRGPKPSTPPGTKSATSSPPGTKDAPQPPSTGTATSHPPIPVPALSTQTTLSGTEASTPSLPTASSDLSRSSDSPPLSTPIVAADSATAAATTATTISAPASASVATTATASPTSTSSTPSASSHSPTTVTEQIAEKARLERMATKAQREAAEKATAHARKPVPAPSACPSTNDAPHLARLEPYIILEAGRATGRDSLYLDAIGRRFADDKTAAAWQRFWRYFDGHSALERIALQEDMKRKEVWTLLTAMSEYLLCVRHW